MEADCEGWIRCSLLNVCTFALLRYLVIARSRCVADGIWLLFASLCCGTEAKREMA